MTGLLFWAAAVRAAAVLPATADLRPAFGEGGLTPKSQRSRGCCSLFAVVGVVEFELWRSTGQPVRLSEEYCNWASHETNGRGVDGSFFSDALNGIAQHGLCREELMPYQDEFKPDLEPSDEARADAATRRSFRAEWIKEWDPHTGMSEEQLAAMRRALADGHPVALGMRWPKKDVYNDAHTLAVPPAEEVFDGHSIVLVGYTDSPDQPGEGTFIFRNSSGPDWRDGGYAYMPYAYARAYGNDAVTIHPAVD